MDRHPGANQAPSQAFFPCEIAKVDGQRVEYFVDRKITWRRTKMPRFDLVDIEEAGQHVCHGLQRAADADNRPARGGVVNLLRQCALQYPHGLQWLTQVMTRRGEN